MTSRSNLLHSADQSGLFLTDNYSQNIYQYTRTRGHLGFYFMERSLHFVCNQATIYLCDCISNNLCHLVHFCSIGNIIRLDDTIQQTRKTFPLLLTFYVTNRQQTKQLSYQPIIMTYTVHVYICSKYMQFLFKYRRLQK